MWVGRPILICVRRAPRVGICPPSTDTRTAKLGPTGAGHLWLPHDFEDVDVHAARANRRHPIGRANPLLTTLGSMSAGRARVHLGTFFWSQPRSIQTRDSRRKRETSGMVVHIVDALILAESVDPVAIDFVGARRFGGISTRSAVR